MPKDRTGQQTFVCTVPNVFSDFEIDYINEKIVYSGEKGVKGKLGGSAVGEGEVVEEIRNSDVFWLHASKNPWIFEKIWAAVTKANDMFWKFDIMRFTPQMGNAIQYTVYESKDKGHYDWHMDTGRGLVWHRKLSFSIQMSHPREYVGGSFMISEGSDINRIASTTKGDMTIFPSFLQHRVSRVTEGRRRSMVGWVGGPAWR